MELQPLDIAIILTYMLGMIVVGFVVERRARGGIDNYFLGGHKMPWWILSMSNAASMFDVSGTMWLVSLLYVYGLKSVFIPWLWPVFNQIFLMATFRLGSGDQGRQPERNGSRCASATTAGPKP